MAPEPALGATGPGPAKVEAAPRFKFRIRFRKAGDLRLVSHHDLMHVCERMFRRADLPVARTQGFNPRPRMWFALSLALGVRGDKEVLELELTAALAVDDVQKRLAAQAPPGFDIIATRLIEPRAAARVRRAFYRLPLMPPVAEAAARCEAFLQEARVWVERLRPQRRRIDVRSYVSELTATNDEVRLALWITSTGAARPEEVFEALGLGEHVQAGAILERTDLELYDELSEDMARQPLPPSLTGAAEPLPDDESEPIPEAPSPTRHTALLPGPLSFDS